MRHQRAVVLGVATFVVGAALVVGLLLALTDELTFIGTAIPLAIVAASSWIAYRIAVGRDPFG